jgi:hypothetical protein
MGVCEHSIWIDSGFVGGGWPIGEDEPQQEDEKIDLKEIDMTDWAIVAFDGCGYLYAGGKLHPLVNTPSTDEQKFVEDIYAMAREQRDRGEMPHILLGDGQDVIYGVGPWGKKLAEILAR